MRHNGIFRTFDVVLATFALAVAAIPTLIAMLLVFLGDFRSPLYVAPRVGRNGKPFKMMKLRSMRVGADKSGVASTKADDPRITRVGAAVRRTKLDEVPQLLNVLAGHMSLIGPRPNVPSEVALYTEHERRLLDVRPGITDLASIVFADEGDILKGSDDPDLRFHQVVRPWKSRLALLYVEHRSVRLALRILALTVRSAVDRRRALAGVATIVESLGAPKDLVAVAQREADPPPAPPPGADAIVAALPATSR